MDAIELLDIISNGETSKVQFKEKMPKPDDFAKEIVAMSNSLGGVILLGVKDKTGEIVGLSTEEFHDYGIKVADIADNKVIPVVYITTEVVSVELDSVKKILVVHVNEGINKPYKVRKTLKVYVKQGDTKRQVSDNAEMLRLFQQSGNLSADEMEVYDTSINDIDLNLFSEFYLQEEGVSIDNIEIVLKLLFRNLNIQRNDKLTLGGLLFFGKNPQRFKPAFCIKAISFFGNDIAGSEYRDSKDVKGTIPILFKEGMRFFKTNLKQIQQGQNVNSIGILEISSIALEEVLVNALVHRDYFKNSPIRIMIFDNRIEILSPGSLPNNLTVENIKVGNSAVRNNLISTFCSKVMKYRGFGFGIKRALKEQPNIEFINDVEGEQFKVIIPRPEE